MLYNLSSNCSHKLPPKVHLCWILPFKNGEKEVWCCSIEVSSVGLIQQTGRPSEYEYMYKCIVSTGDEGLGFSLWFG